MLYHGRNDTTQQHAGYLQTGVRIDFNQPNFELSVNHKVQSKYLKVVLPSVWV
jgi:hypothetical protein